MPTAFESILQIVVGSSVAVPPNSYAETLPPKRMLLKEGPLGDKLGREGEAPKMGLVTL